MDFELCCPSGQLSQTSGLCLKLAKADSGTQVVFELSGPLGAAVSSKWIFELCCPSGQLSQTSGLCLMLAKADSGIQVVFEIRSPFRAALSSKWYLR